MSGRAGVPHSTRRPQARTGVQHKASWGSPALSHPTLRARAQLPSSRAKDTSQSHGRTSRGFSQVPDEDPAATLASGATAKTGRACIRVRPSGQPGPPSLQTLRLAARKGNQSCWSPEALSVRLGRDRGQSGSRKHKPGHRARSQEGQRSGSGSLPEMTCLGETSKWEWPLRGVLASLCLVSP